MIAHSGKRALDGLRILVVEDTDDVRELLAFLLRADGAEVQSAGCARAAVEAAAAWDFDVLLTDIGLPDISGDRLIRQIFGLKTSRPRVVAITGFGEPHIGHARRAGAEVVFTKPLDWSDLRARLTAPTNTLAA